jgi:hypothetical protein
MKDSLTRIDFRMAFMLIMLIGWSSFPPTAAAADHTAGVANEGTVTWSPDPGWITKTNVKATTATVQVAFSVDVTGPNADGAIATIKIGTVAGGTFTEIASYTQNITTAGVTNVSNGFQNMTRGTTYTVRTKVEFTLMGVKTGGFVNSDGTITP